MFPAPKKVAFKALLTEEIRNEKYTLRHSDIETSRSEPESKALDAVDDDDVADIEVVEATAMPKSKATSPKTGDKRDSSDEEDSDTCPATPVAGRKKRHRQWRWTLGPNKEEA